MTAFATITVRSVCHMQLTSYRVKLVWKSTDKFWLRNSCVFFKFYLYFTIHYRHCTSKVYSEIYQVGFFKLVFLRLQIESWQRIWIISTNWRRRWKTRRIFPTHERNRQEMARKRRRKIRHKFGVSMLRSFGADYIDRVISQRWPGNFSIAITWTGLVQVNRAETKSIWDRCKLDYLESFGSVDVT